MLPLPTLGIACHGHHCQCWLWNCCICYLHPDKTLLSPCIFASLPPGWIYQCVSDWQCQHYMPYRSCCKNGAKASTCHFLLSCTSRVMGNPDPIPCLRRNRMHMSDSQYHQWYQLDRHPELTMSIIFCQKGKNGYDSTPSTKQTIKMIKKRYSCITQWM